MPLPRGVVKPTFEDMFFSEEIWGAVVVGGGLSGGLRCWYWWVENECFPVVGRRDQRNANISRGC